MAAAIQRLNIEDRQLQLLIAQYLHEKGLYQTLYSLQLESKEELQFCCRQIDTINTLFAAESYEDCIKFLQSLKQSEERDMVVLQLEMLAILITSQSLEDDIQNYIARHAKQLASNQVQLYQSVNDQNSEDVYSTVRQQTFQQLQEYIHPYYNQFVDDQSVFNKMQPQRLQRILEGYYRAQLAAVKTDCGKSIVNINIFEDLVDHLNAPPTQQQALAVGDARQGYKETNGESTAKNTQDATECGDNENLSANAEVQTDQRGTHNTRTLYGIDMVRQYPQRVLKENTASDAQGNDSSHLRQSELIFSQDGPQLPIEKHSIAREDTLGFLQYQPPVDQAASQKIVVIQSQINLQKYTIQLVSHVNGDLYLMEFTQQCCRQILKYNGQASMVLHIPQYRSFFIAVDTQFQQLSLYDVNFSTPMKTICLGETFQRACNDEGHIYAISGGRYCVVDVDNFGSVQWVDIPVELPHSSIKEELLQVFDAGRVLFTNKQFMYRGKVRSYQGSRILNSATAQIYRIGESSCIVQDRGIWLLDMESGAFAMLYDRTLKTVVAQQNMVFGLNDERKIVQIHLDSFRVQISTKQLLPGVGCIFVQNNFLFWLRSDQMYGHEWLSG